MKARIAVTAAVVVIAATAAGGSFWKGRQESAQDPAPTPAAVASAKVIRADLAETKTLRGTLGYGSPRQIKGRQGTVTWLPRPGATIRRGEQIVRVDDRPVTVFYGDLPLYRNLTGPLMAGNDVAVVAQNLEALGYAVGDLGGKKTAPRFTEKLTAAVKSWQADTLRPVTGAIAVGDVVVLPGAVRVDSVAAQTGDDATAAILSVTPTKKIVTAQVELGELAMVRAGRTVSLALPDGGATPGKVTDVGTTLRSEAGTPDSPQTFAVTITPVDARKFASFDAGDVQVTITSKARKNVLVVPVGALLALSEGGYAVQLGDGRLVAVRTGMFSRGLVEVTGTGLTEGQSVVTTS
uniref:hypothetical protein n=1 Tax=Paractinoplanes polyasparticus TaxID=2856853 RepID=UPI001C8433F9|nr:hypothetical protein [Actinoplanes polyasparticus]